MSLGLFDDLIPGGTAKSSAGLFDDLVPTPKDDGIAKIFARGETAEDQRRAAAGREYTVGQKSSEFLTSVANDPKGFVKSLPGSAMQVLGAPGKVAYAAAADLVAANEERINALLSDIHGTQERPAAPEYGGNLRSLMAGEESLPADRLIRSAAKDAPNLALTAKLGEALPELASMMAVNPGGTIGRLVSLGFSLDMIHGAKPLFDEYAEESAKPLEEQDAGKLNELKASIVQTFVFAPLAGAHAAAKPKPVPVPTESAPPPPSKDVPPAGKAPETKAPAYVYDSPESQAWWEKRDELTAAADAAQGTPAFRQLRAEREAHSDLAYTPEGMAAGLGKRRIVRDRPLSDVGNVRDSEYAPTMMGGTDLTGWKFDGDWYQSKDGQLVRKVVSPDGSKKRVVFQDSLHPLEKAELESNTLREPADSAAGRYDRAKADLFKDLEPDPEPVPPSELPNRVLPENLGDLVKQAETALSTDKPASSSGTAESTPEASKLEQLQTLVDEGLATRKQKQRLKKLKAQMEAETPAEDLSPAGKAPVDEPGVVPDAPTAPQGAGRVSPTGTPAGEVKPTPAEPKLSKQQRADSREFDRLVLEHGPEQGWVNNFDALAVPVSGGLQDKISITAKLMRSKELQKARRNAAKDMGLNPDRTDLADRAAMLPKLREHVAKLEAAKEPQRQAGRLEDATQPGEGKKEVPTRELHVGDVLSIAGEDVHVAAKDTETGDVTLQDGTQFGRQTLADGSHIYVEEWARPEARAEVDSSKNATSAESGSRSEKSSSREGNSSAASAEPILSTPESVAEQTAREAREEAQAKTKADRENLAERQAKPLTGSVGDIGQGDMFGGGDLFSAKAEASEKPQPETNRERVERYLQGAHGIRPDSHVVVFHDMTRRVRGYFDAENQQIFLNSAWLDGKEAVNHTLWHELGHWAAEEGAMDYALSKLTEGERAAIKEQIQSLRYHPSEYGPEKQALGMQQLMHSWLSRNWFQQAVGNVLKWAHKLGFPLTRLGAESVATEAMIRAYGEAKQEVKLKAPPSENGGHASLVGPDLQAKRDELAEAVKDFNQKSRDYKDPALRIEQKAGDLRQAMWDASKKVAELRDALGRDPEHVEDLLLQAEDIANQIAIARAGGEKVKESALLDRQDQFFDQFAFLDPKTLNFARIALEKRGAITTIGPLVYGRSLAELTDKLKKGGIDSPKLSWGDRLNLGKQLVDRMNFLKDNAQIARAKLQAIWQSILDNYRIEKQSSNLANSEFKTVLKEWKLADEETGIETHKWQQAIRDAIPDPVRRAALRVWMDARGDLPTLEAQAQSVPARFTKIWKTALKLTRDEQRVGREIIEDFRTKLEDGKRVGFLDKGREDYAGPQIWEIQPEPPAESDSSFATGEDSKRMGAGNPRAKLDSRNPFFTLPRDYDTYFEGIMAGGIPKTLDVAPHVAEYNLAFHKSLSSRAMVSALKDSQAADGMPITKISGSVREIPKEQGGGYVVDSGKLSPSDVTADGRMYRSLDHPALKDFKTLVKLPDGRRIAVTGDMLIHPDHYQHLENVLMKSPLRDGGPGKVLSPVFLLNAYLKASKLAGAGFHLMTIGEHMLSHGVNPLNRGFELDLRDPQQRLLVRNGLELGASGGQGAFEEGLSSHGGAMKLVPGLGDWMAKLSDWMFKDYIPTVMMRTGLKVLERNRARYGKELTENQLAELTALQMNAAGGLINYRQMGRSPVLMDLGRIALLAPQFLEARARVVAQALKPYGAEQRRMLITQAAGLYLIARTVNYMINDDAHWEAENAFSVVYKGRAYGIRTIVGDAFHMVTDPASFAAGRLSPLFRMGIETMTQRDMRTGARKEPPIATNSTTFRLAQNLIVDMVKWLAPVGVEGLLPGAAGREQGPVSTLLGSVGIGSRKYTEETQIRKLASEYNRNGDTQAQLHQKMVDGAAYGESDYRKLDALLDAGEVKAAQKELNSMLRGGYQYNRIVSRFGAINRPFTGNGDRETKFKETLSPAQQKAYDRAIESRRGRLDRFQQLERPKEPDEPAAPAPTTAPRPASSPRSGNA